MAHVSAGFVVSLDEKSRLGWESGRPEKQAQSLPVGES